MKITFLENVIAPVGAKETAHKVYQAGEEVPAFLLDRKDLQIYFSVPKESVSADSGKESKAKKK